MDTEFIFWSPTQCLSIATDFGEECLLLSKFTNSWEKRIHKKEKKRKIQKNKRKKRKKKKEKKKSKKEQKEKRKKLVLQAIIFTEVLIIHIELIIC